MLVLDRLSYSFDKPDQPLLLLAEATSGSSIGVQTSYYMYDTRDITEVDPETEETKKVTGTNEHKIPKFICRPKYQRLTDTPYTDISPVYIKASVVETDSISSPYSVTPTINTSTGEASTVITCNSDSTDRRLVTIEFDWTPKNSNNFLSIRNGQDQGEVEILRHYVPNCSAKVPYRVKLVVPLYGFISTSKKNELATLQNQLVIKEATVTNPDDVLNEGTEPIFTLLTPGTAASASYVANRLDISNIAIYEGIKLTDYADC